MSNVYILYNSVTAKGVGSQTERGGGDRGVAIQTKSSCILCVYWVQLTAVVMKSKQ